MITQFSKNRWTIGEIISILNNASLRNCSELFSFEYNEFCLVSMVSTQKLIINDPLTNNPAESNS